MSGRYKKAPLIYMVARVHATSIPQLTSDQKAELGQTMRALGYRVEVDSLGHEWGLNFAYPTESKNDSTYEVDERQYKRKAYFDDSKTNVFIFENESIEFRTTAYTTYVDVAERIQSVIEGVCDSIPVCKDILVREISLTYVDLIFPINGRHIKDYFDSKEAILPLSIFNVSDNDDVLNFGSIQVTRVVEPDKRIVISLEQLPVSNEGLPTKTLPNRLVEREPKLGMPISFNVGQSDTVSNDKKHYALLTTESGAMLSLELQDLDFKKSSETIHKQTSTMFKGLINREVCEIDWEYVKK